MLLKFATKRNTNGHRHDIAIDTEKKVYSQNPHGILFKGDFIETTKTALQQIKQKAIDDKYILVDAL